MKRNIIIISFLLAVTADCLSQGLHTGSNKALQKYNEGMRYYDYLEFTRAEQSFREALGIDNKFYEVHLALGDLLLRQRRFSEAAESYRTAVRIDSLFYKPLFFSLATAEIKSGDYEKALIHYKVYLDQKGMSEKNMKLAERGILNCEFAIEALKKPIPFNPVNAGPGINTPDDEYWPSITADGSTLMFTRQLFSTTPSHEDFYVSTFRENIWQKAVTAGNPLNTSQNEGAQSLSSDGRYMYFTACDRRGGMGSCDIYYSALSDGKWSMPVNLRSPVNTGSWESTPSVSADGKMLFFSSNRPGGSGGKDLWLSRLDSNNVWSKPENLGPGINTEGDEMSPFIHFDGKTLYFSSDGRPGMGGFDIYMTTLTGDTAWEEPRNLGYPINTYNDETGLAIGSDGRLAYFSSMRDRKSGKDIFWFELHESVRPDPVSYIKGKVHDGETGKLLRANFELINLSTGKTTQKGSTDGTGNFLVCLPAGYNYGINVSSKGYLFYSGNFMFEGEHSIAEPFVKRIDLSPIKTGEKMQLSNVFYEINSWELKSESRSELDNLAALLLAHKDIAIEIGGYTDATGSDEYNLGLSEKRALSVVEYLVGKGVPRSRLTHKGYGSSAPIGDNVTLEGRRMNRRTEARIISSGPTKQ